MSTPAHNYTEDSIKSLDWREHIRLRPGMYIGKLGDGSQPEDGIYVLLKEVIDNCIDEHVMGYGKVIEVEITEDHQATVRDFGRGIPLGKLMECAVCSTRDRRHERCRGDHRRCGGRAKTNKKSLLAKHEAVPPPAFRWMTHIIVCRLRICEPYGRTRRGRA